jgi:hypothetical protein
MIRSTGKKPFRILITGFTIFVAVAGFCFVSVEPPRAAGAANGVAGWVDNFIPSAAEEPALFIKTEDSRSGSPQTEFQRMFIPCGTHGTASEICYPSAGTSSNISLTGIKTTILLKRRI